MDRERGGKEIQGETIRGGGKQASDGEDGSAIQAQSGRDTGNWKSCAKRMGLPQSGSGEADKQGGHQQLAGAEKASAPDR
jgi:hypothetical protein